MPDVVIVEAIGLVGVAASPFANGLGRRIGGKRVVMFLAGIAIANPALVGLIAARAPDVRGSAVAFNAFLLFLGATVGAFVPSVAGVDGGYALIVIGLAAAGGDRPPRRARRRARYVIGCVSEWRGRNPGRRRSGRARRDRGSGAR